MSEHEHEHMMAPGYVRPDVDEIYHEYVAQIREKIEKDPHFLCKTGTHFVDILAQIIESQPGHVQLDTQTAIDALVVAQVGLVSVAKAMAPIEDEEDPAAQKAQWN